jgi:hypothetical protein
MILKREITIIFLILLSVTLVSAQETFCTADYSNEFVGLKPGSDIVRQYLLNKYKDQLKNSDLVLDYERKSKAAWHYNFSQSFGDTKILDAEIKVSLDLKGKIIAVYNNLISESENGFSIASSQPPKVEMETAVVIWKADEVLIRSTVGFHTAKRFFVTEKKGIGHELIFDSKGLYRDRITSCFFLPDSIVTALVFDPDPLTTANAIYGGNFHDFNDGDSASVLNSQRKLKTFKVNFNDSIFELKNDYIELQDLHGDLTPIATSSVPNFNYTRSESGFEDVNAFYHLSTIQNHLAQFGFNSVMSKVLVDPSGGDFDNSYFTVPGSLYFGTGGVDDAEDADVIVHEYTHFISYSAAPNSNVGNERNALDEGSCDYMAASYSKAINNFNWQWVYNWDGHNEFWNGRVVSTSKVYPANKVNNIYRDGEMWSATLMEIYDELGRNTTDELLMETMYQFVPNMSFEMAAQALLMADTLLFNGANFCIIYKYLLNRGLLSFRQNNCGISAINEIIDRPIEMVHTANGFVIRNINGDVKINSVILLNTSGQIVKSNINNVFDEKRELSSDVYFVAVETNQGNYTLKWANY